MSRILEFLAGALSGAVVGATAVVLLTPASGEDLRQQARDRWESALAEGRRAMASTQAQLEEEYTRLTQP